MKLGGERRWKTLIEGDSGFHWRTVNKKKELGWKESKRKRRTDSVSNETLFLGLWVNVSETALAAFFASGSDDEGCKAVKVSGVPCRSVPLPELMQLKSMCEDSEIFRVDSDVDSCCSGVSVVTAPWLAFL